jgi:hypothetical protein
MTGAATSDDGTNGTSRHVPLMVAIECTVDLLKVPADFVAHKRD